MSYDPCLEIARFRWDVPDKGYVWIENASQIIDLNQYDKGGLKTHEPDMCLMINPEGEMRRRYDPRLVEPPLWSQFADLDTDPASINKFANKYGWLGVGKWVITAGSERKKHMPIGERLTQWKDEIKTFKRVAQVWEWVQNEDAGKLGQVIVWHDNAVAFELKGDDGSILEFRLIAGEMEHPELFRTWERGKTTAPAKLYLLKVVNEHLAGVQPRLLLNKKGCLQEYIYPANLLSSVWYEFSQVLSGQRKIRRCEICHRIMDVTESRSNKTQHTTCGNRERQDRMKARNLHKQGMSLESIAQEVSKPPEWVKELLEGKG